MLFQREAFVSYPDQVFVLHLFANKPGQQAFKLSMSSPHDRVTVEARGEGALLLSGQMMPHTPPVGSWISSWDGPGLRFAGQVQLMQKGGSHTRDGNAIVVEGADEVTLLACLGTSFVNYRDIGSRDPMLLLKQQIERSFIAILCRFEVAPHRGPRRTLQSCGFASGRYDSRRPPNQ